MFILIYLPSASKGMRFKKREFKFNFMFSVYYEIDYKQFVVYYTFS